MEVDFKENIKTEVVVIGQNEGRFVDNMLRKLPCGWNVHYVADRCTDNTVCDLYRVGYVDVIDTSGMGLKGRQTSFCRNLGLSKCKKDSDVLFLDGDRYPIGFNLKDVVDECKTDILLFGVQNDYRTPEIVAEQYGTVCNFFYSCGLFMKRNAIDKVTEFQNGELFRTDMQEEWGIEDTCLGDVCYHLGLTCAFTDKVRLNGSFERTKIDKWETMKKRFKFRETLNVRWY